MIDMNSLTFTAPFYSDDDSWCWEPGEHLDHIIRTKVLIENPAGVRIVIDIPLDLDWSSANKYLKVDPIETEWVEYGSTWASYEDGGTVEGEIPNIFAPTVGETYFIYEADEDGWLDDIDKTTACKLLNCTEAEFNKIEDKAFDVAAEFLHKEANGKAYDEFAEDYLNYLENRYRESLEPRKSGSADFDPYDWM
jgi:hypothetical protein